MNWTGRIAISRVGRIVGAGTKCRATRWYCEGSWGVDDGSCGCAGSGGVSDGGGAGCFVVDLMADVAGLRTGRGARGVEGGGWYGVGTGARDCYKSIGDAEILRAGCWSCLNVICVSEDRGFR